MPFNGSGVFVRLYSWVTDRDAGTKILASRHDAEDDGFVTGLNSVVDGTQAFIAPVRGTAGTAAAPGHSFSTDTDTGMYRVSADTLGFSVAGTLELQVEAGYADAVNGLKIGGVAVTSTAAELNILDGVTATAAELNIMDGVTVTTANINEAGTFANTFTLPTVDGTSGQFLTTDGLGALTFNSWGDSVSIGGSGTYGSISGNTLTLDLITDTDVATGANIDAAKIGTGVVSNTEFNYLNGVTSALQTQLDAKQASDATLTALAGLSTGANKIPYSTGTDTFGQLDLLDEDNMASNSATGVPTQQSVKAYVDNNTTTAETVHALSGTSVALSTTSGTIKTHTLSGNTTYTDSLSAGESITLMIDDGASRSVTWPTMTWVNNGGVAPTLATSGYTVVVLWKVSTTLYGAFVGDGS